MLSYELCLNKQYSGGATPPPPIQLHGAGVLHGLMVATTILRVATTVVMALDAAPPLVLLVGASPTTPTDMTPMCHLIQTATPSIPNVKCT
jgi:hypothetical protein